MTAENKTYITTTLPYANSVAHVGHALEFVQADFWKRYLPNSYLNIGLDEHGKKIEDKALSQGISPIELVNDLSDKWKSFCELFLINYDNFYRTSDKTHHNKVKEVWNKILDNNEIYLKDYEGYYCKNCEEFKTPSNNIDGFCSDHPTTKLEKVNETNYFFNLSKFKNLNSNIVFPINKRKELQNIIDNSIDISVSRESVNWGVSVPNSEQTIYVWFEALLNYIFSNKDWDNTTNIQICGPDNLRFQGHFFQGILESLGLKQTDKLFVHGTILDKNGDKISKSVGNIIDPIEQVEKFGINAVRYYLLKGISTFGNSKWDEERIVSEFNSDISDNLGNLISRVTHLCNLNNIVLSSNDSYTKKLSINISFIQEKFGIDNDISDYLSSISHILKDCNKYINDETPWKLEDPTEVLSNLHYAITEITELYRPVFGDDKIDSVLSSIKEYKKENYFPKL
tara:strand:- start:21944 stop:23308 length:1365 start_codon:yes stop_codon:yes gene_type:complete